MRNATYYVFAIPCDLNGECVVVVRVQGALFSAQSECAKACRSRAQRERRIVGAVLAGVPLCLDTLGQIRDVLARYHGTFAVDRFIAACAARAFTIVYLSHQESLTP
jgi:hypothetical protein